MVKTFVISTSIDPKHFTHQLNWIAIFILCYEGYDKKLFAYSIIASVLLTIVGIVLSLFNKILMDEILPYKLKNSLLIVVIIFAILAVIQVVIGFVRQWIMIYLSQKIDIEMEKKYGNVL